MRLIGNLPYNISTPLLFHFLQHADRFTDLHIMLQKEVAVRICAGPGSKDYGRLTVALASRCETEMLFTIKPGAFKPPPRVDSAMVRILPRRDRMDRIASPEMLDKINTLLGAQS